MRSRYCSISPLPDRLSKQLTRLSCRTECFVQPREREKKKPSYSREISRCDAARQPGAKRASTRLFAKTIQLEYLKKKACTIRHFNLDGFLDHLDLAPHVPKPRDVPRQSLGSNRSFLRHTWLGNPSSLVIFAELPEALRLFLWCVGEGNGPSAPM